MTVKELRALATQRKIKGRSSLNTRADLIKALSLSSMEISRFPEPPALAKRILIYCHPRWMDPTSEASFTQSHFQGPFIMRFDKG